MGPFDRLTDRAKRVFALAQDEAFRNFHHDYIGPEHLLIALVREGKSPATSALTFAGVELAAVRSTVVATLGRTELREQPDEIVLDPRTRAVLDFAILEAKARGDARVGPGHLLLGLSRDDVLGRVFDALGTTRERVRDAAVAALEPPRDDAADA